jgi:DNA-binding NtrC family response regulator
MTPSPPQLAANVENDAGDAPATQKPWNGFPLKDIVQQKTAALEREILLRVLRETGGNKAKASRLLHIDYKTIHLKLKEYGILSERTRKGES